MEIRCWDIIISKQALVNVKNLNCLKNVLITNNFNYQQLFRAFQLTEHRGYISIGT